MAESFVTLSAGFSTADADRPEIAYARGDLLVKFKDWREQPVALRFPDAVAFRWQDEAALPADVRDDSSYEVIDSVWVAELRSFNALPEEPHHYILCFNAAGVLNVVSGPLAGGGYNQRAKQRGESKGRNKGANQRGGGVARYAVNPFFGE